MDGYAHKYYSWYIIAKYHEISHSTINSKVNFGQTSNSQKTRTSPSPKNYGVSFMSHFTKIYREISRSHCIECQNTFDLWMKGGVLHVQTGLHVLYCNTLIDNIITSLPGSYTFMLLFTFTSLVSETTNHCTGLSLIQHSLVPL